MQMESQESLKPQDITLQRIRDRAAFLAGEVLKTPTTQLSSQIISQRLGDARIFLKLECLQHTGTYKARGALSVALSIAQGPRRAGITAASAGNHAIAAAWAARHIGVSAKVVMLASANAYRVARVRAEGAEVVAVDGVAAVMSEADRLARVEGRFFIHPFEGPYTTLGAAGVGLELIDAVPDLEAVVVAVGGGGLISGVAAAIKQINPNCAVYGVEPRGANSMGRSLATGAPVTLDEVVTVADSLGAPYALPFSFALCRMYIDDVAVVSDEAICAALVLYQQEAKLAVEPAAAAALAGVLGPLRQRLFGKKVGIVVCGANIDAQSFGDLLARGAAQVDRLLGAQ
jgi:threonine dehydratase